MLDRIPRSSQERLLAHLRRRDRHPVLEPVAPPISLSDLATSTGLDRDACHRALDALDRAGTLKVLIGDGGRLDIHLLHAPDGTRTVRRQGVAGG